MRAMREARFAEMEKKAGKRPAKQTAPAPKVALCGHRSVGGKTCIRDADHSEKSHRYAKTEKPG